jgi:hypothetical protein
MMNKPDRPAFPLTRTSSKPTLTSLAQLGVLHQRGANVDAPAPSATVKSAVPKPTKAAPAPAVNPAAPKPTKAAKPALTDEQKAAMARATAIRTLKFDLMEAYPLAFPRPSAAPVPLAIGIHRAILEAVRGQHSTNTLKVFLARWTGAPAYLAALAAGEPRRNLDGTLVGVPTEDERIRAAETIETRKAAKRTP